MVEDQHEGFEGEGALDTHIFLDGSTLRTTHSVAKEPLVADMKAGIAGASGDLRLGFTDVMRTEEFKNQESPHQFGTIHLGFSF